MSAIPVLPMPCPPAWKCVSAGLKSAGILSLMGFVFLLSSLNRSGLSGREQPFFSIPIDVNPDAPAMRNKAFLNFQLVETKDGVNRHVIEMHSDAADWLLSSPTISILLVSNWKVGEVISGKMVFTDQASGKETARYVVKKGSLIQESRKLLFAKKKSAEVDIPAGREDVRLEIVSRGAPELALVAQFSEDKPLSDALWIPKLFLNGKSGSASIFGWFGSSNKIEAFSRARLLAYTWGWGTGAGWIVNFVIIASALIWLIGVITLVHPGHTGRMFPDRYATAAGAGLLFLGIGLVYSLLFPPFQCPDEADHFLSYVSQNSRSDLAGNALDLANTGHFERIKFHTDEHFASADIGAPMQGPWAPHIEECGLNRSIISKTAWSFLGRILGTPHSGAVLLGIRFFNVLFVSLCLSLSLALLAWAHPAVKVSVLMAAPVLLTPSLSFFSMGVSNYPFLVGGYVIQAVALGSIWIESSGRAQNNRPTVATGILIGVGILLAVGSADNGIFSIAFWAILIPSYWFLRGLHSNDLSSEMRKWQCFSAVLLASLFGAWLAVGLAAGDFHMLPPAMTEFIERTVSGTFLKKMGAQALVFSGFCGSAVFVSFLSLSIGSLARKTSGLRFGRMVVVLILFLTVLFVLFAKSIRIPDFFTTPLPEYILRVVYSFFEGFGPGKSDWLVTQSFWGEFGWLDTPMPEFLNNLLRFGAGFGLLALFFSVIKRNTYFAGAGFLLANLIALSAFISCTAAGYYFGHYGINGRYIIGPYLLILTAAYEGYRRLIIDRQPGLFEFGTVNVLLCMICMGVQTSAWVTILNRYF